MTIKDILDVINDLHIDYKISILDDFEINTYCSLNELKENAITWLSWKNMIKTAVKRYYALKILYL